MKALESQIKQLSRIHLDWTRSVRRHIHQHPELSFQEKETSAFISSELAKLDIPHQTGLGGYGIRAVITGLGKTGSPGNPDDVVALRADMDALPIQEENPLDFASGTAGVMHACGHDAHSAILLAAARILQESRHAFQGTIVCLFQPAEEKVPGGAQAMIKDGALENPRPRVILGEHVNPGLDAGLAGFRPGLMMASADDFYLRILGKGGHGASPHLCVDPVVISAQIITALQQVASRESDPLVPTVLTFGRIHSEGATNIIPEWVDLEGTFRTMDNAWRERFCAGLADRVRGIARSLGGDAEVRLDRGYPPVLNDTALTLRVQDQARKFLGQDRVVDLPAVMWAEDFAYYGRQIPACFYNLGIRNEASGWTRPLHNPRLMVDETILETGPALMAWLAVSELR